MVRVRKDAPATGGSPSAAISPSAADRSRRPCRSDAAVRALFVLSPPQLLPAPSSARVAHRWRAQSVLSESRSEPKVSAVRCPARSAALLFPLAFLSWSLAPFRRLPLLPALVLRRS